ncbi:hypothetical protein GW17_00056375 [Ensete ventricosum]|nr:hypothetical protein GW17_00056375 [Ensete ventricosum]
MANRKEAKAAALWSKAMAMGGTRRGSLMCAASMQVRMGDIEGHVSFTCHQVCVSETRRYWSASCNASIRRRIPGSTIVVPVDGVVRFLELFEELKLDSEVGFLDYPILSCTPFLVV